MAPLPRVAIAFLVTIALTPMSGQVLAEDEITVYELREPGSHAFAIRFDVTTTRPGARHYLNPIRPGSVVRDERVVDRHTGEELDWEVISAAEARSAGLLAADSRANDEDLFLKIALREPVAEGGEARLRIFKTYEDPASYAGTGDEIVFARSLGIRANAVILPAGYELVESSVPPIVSTLPDGRVKASFLNDRDDTLEVRLVGRRLPPGRTLEGTTDGPQHRAEQDREITYWLLEPETHSFRISHDFTAGEPGQRYVHNFVRAGSEASDPVFTDLDRAVRLPVEHLTGAEVNAAGTYSRPLDDDAVVIQAELVEPIGEGESVRIRVEETYTDPGRYTLDGHELVWDRTLGRPYNVVFLPSGWTLTGVSTPATLFNDAEGRVGMRFINPRNDSLRVVIRARPRNGR